MEVISQLPELSIGGIPVAVATLATVQVMRWSGYLVDGAACRRAVPIVALIFAATWVLWSLVPAWQPYIETAYVALLGVAGATLAYQGLDKVTNRDVPDG